MSLSSVATQTLLAPLSRARSATRTTMGLPPRSARALRGRRVEARRAGMMAVKCMPGRGPLIRLSFAHFLFGSQLPRFVLEHHRDAVPNGEREPVGLAYELALPSAVHERPLADRADENI